MQSAAVEDRETASLIASDKVEGTAVYDADGKRIGKIERLMIDKLTGKVAYAVMSFGGILGIGADHYSIPWSLLRYNKSSAAIKSTSPNSSSRTPRNLAKTRIGTGPAGRMIRTSMTIGG
jgi:sporulation protein YlmC with PRC-barrel domain